MNLYFLLLDASILEVHHAEDPAQELARGITSVEFWWDILINVLALEGC